MENHNHIVEVDFNKREVFIYRTQKNGGKVFLTSSSLPDFDVLSETHKFDEFSKQLGESILLDSPSFRKVYGL